MKRYALVTLLVALASSSARSALAQEAAPVPPEAKLAQEPAEPPQTSPPARLQLVRLQIVLARYQGETKTASIPYTLVTSTDRSRAVLRMGVEVPVAMAPGSSSYQYRSVGTNIDCRAQSSGDRYQIELNVENSSVYGRPDEAAPAKDAALAPDKMFRKFAVQLSLVMRDGQSLQTVASTDPVTGEVVKIDVTLKVVK